MFSQEDPIAVVGNGCFAHLVAHALRQKNIEVLHFCSDNHTAVRFYALSQRSIALLERLDVWRYIDDATPIEEMEVFCDNEPLSLSAYHAATDRLASMVSEKGLLQALQMDPNPNTEPDSITHFAHHPDGVTVHTKANSYCCRAVIGADGGKSLVRRYAAININHFGYAQSALTFVVRVEKTHNNRALQWFIGSGQEQEIVALLPLTDNHMCVVWSQPSQTARMRSCAEASELTQTLTRYSKGILGTLSLMPNHSAHIFPLQWSYAEKIFERNIFLLGDAAHTVHPFAGQGANLGFDDLAALLDALPDNVQSIDVPNWGRDYAKQRQLPLYSKMVGLHLLWRSFNSPYFPSSWGLRLVNSVPLLKKAMITLS